MYNFRFAGEALSERFGVTTKTPPREVALYDGTLSSIPGHNGDVFTDNKRWKNVSFQREIGFGYCPIGGDPVEGLINWLGYNQGYQEFEDSDHPGMITYAVLTNFNQVQTQLRKIHTATLNFSRVPFWYDKESLNPIVMDTAEAMSDGITLFNPYPIYSQPLIEVVLKTAATSSDSFTLKFNTDTVAYNLSDFPIESGTNFRKYIYFDSETEETRIQKNEAGDSTVYVDIDPRKGLDSGKTTFSVFSGWTYIDTLKITPRWRCL